MAVQFLLDEHVEPRVRHKLEAYGYDAETVGGADGLDLGDEDVTLGSYSRRTNRVIVTYDDDFVTGLERNDYYGVVYFEDSTVSARNVADILHEMASAYPESEFQRIQYGTSEWL